MMRKLFFVVAGTLLCNLLFAQQHRRTEKLLIITLDGYRWKELFRGADTTLFSRTFFGQDSLWKIQKYWGKDSLERRTKLMPFFWNTIARKGQLYGNRDHGNYMNVKNKYWVSYPGYNEMFTGYPDTSITNSSPPNPNYNVLEFINQQPGYENKVAVFASWDAYHRILNSKRSGLFVNSGWEDVQGGQLTEQQELLNAQQHYLPKIFGREERVDAATFALARAYLQQHHPKVLYIAFIDTDAFAHRWQYDFYLDAAHYIDAMIAALWQYMQQDPFYKDQTTLLITTDHGRGAGQKYSDHNWKTPYSDETWLAVMGPDTPPLGEVKRPGQLYTNQLATTIAAFLGLNFTSKNPIGEQVQTVLKQ